MHQPYTFITPTIEKGEPISDLSAVRYYPGMQISVNDKTFASRLQEVYEAGFRYVELKFKHEYGLHEKSDAQVSEAFTLMQQMLMDKGIRIWSVHLPFGNDEWSDLGGEEEVRKRSTNHYIRTLRLCATHFPDCRTFVTHGSKGTLTPRSKSVGQTRKALKELVPVANELGVRLCVENLVTSIGSSFPELEEVCKEHPELYYTFDIGHANCNGFDVVEFLKKDGTKLGTVHIHDTIFGSGDDAHLLVGKGNIDRWGEVYRTLLETNRYRGVFMFEPKDHHNAKDVMATYDRIVEDFLKTFE